MQCKKLQDTEDASNRERIMVNDKDVEEFPNLRAMVDKEGRGSRDIINRLQKARIGGHSRDKQNCGLREE